MPHGFELFENPLETFGGASVATRKLEWFGAKITGPEIAMRSVLNNRLSFTNDFYQNMSSPTLAHFRKHFMNTESVMRDAPQALALLDAAFADQVFQHCRLNLAMRVITRQIDL